MNILIYGEIGTDVKAAKVAEQLAKSEGDIVVQVNSPGGDVYEGLAIMNALRGYAGHVTAVIEGLAASAASFIAVGGADRVVARPHSELMIHSAWSMGQGNADDLTKLADDLNRISANLANIYADKTGADVSEMAAAMRAETWYSAQEALEAGLVDAVEDARVPQVEPQALGYAKVLARYNYAGRESAPAPEINTRADSPPTHLEENSMTILDKLAATAGVTVDELRNELNTILNETVEVPVAIEYPETAEVIPTGKVEIEPVNDVPGDAAIEVTAPEGFTAEVAEGGKIVVRASDTVSVDDTADIVLTVGKQEARITVTVVAADKDDDETEDTPEAPAVAPESDTTPGAEFGEVPKGFALVPQEHLDDLTARAALGDEAFNAKADADLEAEVDGWIKDGRFSAARRESVLASMRSDSDLTRKTWGNLPVNSIPRSEIGYGRDPEDPEVEPKRDLRKLAESRLSIK